MEKRITLIISSSLTGTALGIALAIGASNWIVSFTGLLFAIPFGLMLKTWAEGIIDS